MRFPTAGDGFVRGSEDLAPNSFWLRYMTILSNEKVRIQKAISKNECSEYYQVLLKQAISQPQRKNPDHGF